ncbi:MerR family transcriptional regulator [Desulfuromonas thiophila]|uniref:Transcriptional regulator, MerR family n=1 Tax=Desulfuromonas thiophila TaxID=57664 RepID=A0A1G7ERW8_9BACT|nr:MerR family transcriptional regulator [Desulfuromonas thiophila]SDE66389.1 transcriptional regulator, MerR family [Desulfuromonas thiophila]
MQLGIQQLSDAVGIGVDTLRVWERRYGLPCPTRDGRGRRQYDATQVELLRQVRQLQLAGWRPQRIFALNASERADQLRQLQPDTAVEASADWLSLPVAQLQTQLRAQLNQLGIEAFVVRSALPLLAQMDAGWCSGRLTIAQEHLLSDTLSAVLQDWMAGQTPSAAPDLAPARCLFATLNGERHRLALLLAAALLRSRGLNGLLLQEPLPVSEVAPLVASLELSAVALSFSSHYSARQALADLQLLRRQLPTRVRLIAGGQALASVARLPGVLLCHDLRQCAPLYRRLGLETAPVMIP